MLLSPDRVSSLFWTVVVVMFAVQLIPTSGDVRAGVLMTLVLGGVVAVIWLAQKQRDASSAAVETTVAKMSSFGGGVNPHTIDNDMYVLRNGMPTSRPLRHLALRPHVKRALAPLRSHVARDRGKIGRLLVCLEDFYTRFDFALLGSPSKAARTMRNLLDLRAEAINTMHTLVFSKPASVNGRAVDTAIHVVRQDTQRCMAALSARHAGHIDMATAEWRPPYAHDPRRDPLYHVAV